MQATAFYPTVNDFYEDDLVEVDADFFAEYLPPENRRFRVNTTSVDGITVTSLTLPHSHDTILSTELEGKVTLVRRGNVFRYLFSADTLEFQSAAEEVDFWVKMRQAYPVRNADTGFWVWELRAAADALKDRTVDVIIMTCGEYGRGFIFNDRAVAERLRTTTLAELQKLIGSR